MNAVKQAIASQFEAVFPQSILALREEWELSDHALPLPADGGVFAYEPNIIDRWPMIYVAATGAPDIVRRNADDVEDGIVYDVTYRIRVFCWIRETGKSEADRARGDFSAAVRRFILDNPQWGLPDDILVTNESTLVEEYSDVTPARGDRFIAGSYVEFEVLAAEVITRPGATAQSVPLTVTHHPALE